MLFVLSPAKTLDFETPVDPGVPHTAPRLSAPARELIELLRVKTPAQIASLMDLSDKLATLNVARYQAFSARHTASNSRQAILAFNGDVYDGLDARSLRIDDLTWAQDHLRMLSGLYGVLRPLDRMQPYRLEMGTALAHPGGRDLYSFWGGRIAQTLRHDLAGHAEPVLVNLASQEYFRAVDVGALGRRVVECVFEEGRDGRWRIISFNAKRARGRMARFAIDRRIDQVEGLKDFDADGYRFDAHASEADRLVFRREAP